MEWHNTYFEAPVIESVKIMHTTTSSFNIIFMYSRVGISVESTKNNARIQVRENRNGKRKGG